MTGLQEGGAYGPQCVCMLQASVFVSAFSAAHSRVLWSGGFLAFSCAVPKAEGGTGPQVETLWQSVEGCRWRPARRLIPL